MRFEVEGMNCGHCVRAITEAVVRLGGVAQVDLPSGQVEVSGIRDAEAVRRAIEAEGYQVRASFPDGDA